MDLQLEGKVALVTGAGQGVGQRIAQTLAAEGACVGVNDLSPERAQRVVDGITAAGGKAIAAVYDVTDRSALDEGVDLVARTFGPITVLVNNAGIIPERRTGELGVPVFIESDPTHWRKIVDLNYFGTLNNCAAVLPAMIEAGEGKIINIISEAARIGEARMAVYSGAKAAILGFTKALAREVGPQGINVNTVALAAVSHEAALADFQHPDATAENNETLRRVLRSYPIGQALGRLARPEEPAAAVAFLASHQSAYVTGQCLGVSGGYAIV